MAKDFSEIQQWYLSNFELFEDKLNGGRQNGFHEIRKKAIDRFRNLGFPTPRDEEWKYTNVKPLLQHKFKLQPEEVSLKREQLKPFLFEGLKENMLVYVNGVFNSELSSLELSDENVIIGSLKEALDEKSDVLAEHLGRYARFENETFTALNTAFIDEGTLVFVPDNTTVEAPIHLINITSTKSGEFISHPRNLFVVGRNSHVHLVESFHCLDDDLYFNNLVTEIFVDRDARVDHLKLQEESERAFHISNTYLQQEKHSYFNTVHIDLGGSLVRNNLEVTLNDERCETHLFGFFLGTGTQHIDNHTFIDHAKPNCFSNEMYKGILDDKARGVFNGKILVRQDAQKTNALQSNKTLLLTDDAQINAKPQLEIFADDVKCTHGATIGQLDDEALFYLRARGIGEEMAGAILRHAFVADVLDHIRLEPIRTRVDEKIINRFTGGKMV